MLPSATLRTARLPVAAVVALALGAAGAVGGCGSTAATTTTANARDVAPQAGPARLGGAAPDVDALRRDVNYLAGDALEGRATGTAGGDSAADYVARRFEALGLAPAVTLVGAEDTARAPCAGARVVIAMQLPGRTTDRSRCHSYFQPFAAHRGGGAAAVELLAARNVVALVRGTSRAGRDEYVVVGAHYDHLGRSSAGSRDPALGDAAIRNGADDNASGTAALLELARLLARRPARRTVVFVGFDAEELGLLGSRHFVDHPPVPLDRARAMLDLDMVGRLRDDRLLVRGVATATALPALLDSANAGLGLRLVPFGDGGGPSDQAPFAARGVPVLSLSTDVHEDYHRVTDDADRVNVAGEARVVTLAERLVRALADEARPSSAWRKE